MVSLDELTGSDGPWSIHPLIDCGTTSVRTIAVLKGVSLAVSQNAHASFPGAGMVRRCRGDMGALRDDLDCLSKPGSIGECVAFGITNQRETVVVWDRDTGIPVHNALVWQDRRTADICERMREGGYSEEILRRTGLQIDAYFSGTKVRWILDNVSGASDAAESGDLIFGTVDTWLIWNLTGGAVHATDYTDASRTMLFNIGTLQWDEGIVDAIRIPRTMFPMHTRAVTFSETSTHRSSGYLLRYPVSPGTSRRPCSDRGATAGVM